MNIFSFVFTFFEGILTFISPCILPMLPIYFIYLAGVKGKNTKNTLLVNSIGFVVGFTIVFVLLGATVTAIGNFLAIHKDIIRKISGVVMIAFGLNFAGILKLNFMNIEKRIDYKINNLNFFSSIVFGIVFGFGWSPCLGAFLGSALALASNSNTMFGGMLLLFVYSVGLAIPFVISAIIFENVKVVFKQIQKHSRLISILSGMLLIISGVLVFTDSLKYINF